MKSLLSSVGRRPRAQLELAALVAMVMAACSLDTTGKNTCVTSADCLGGWSCVIRRCEREEAGTRRDGNIQTASADGPRGGRDNSVDRANAMADHKDSSSSYEDASSRADASRHVNDSSSEHQGGSIGSIDLHDASIEHQDGLSEHQDSGIVLHDASIEREDGSSSRVDARSDQNDNGGTAFFGQGPMKNLYVDVVFWGSLFTDTDRSNVLTYITEFARWLNGAGWPSNPLAPGQEPAAHYYGVQGITPNLWVDDSTHVPIRSSRLDDPDFAAVVASAVNGEDGSAYAFSDPHKTNPITIGLVNGTNTLVIVVTKGSTYCISVASGTGCNDTLNGYHAYNSAMNLPYGAVMLETYAPVISREIVEALTDPVPRKGWSLSHGSNGLEPSETAEPCNARTTEDRSRYAQVDIGLSYLVHGSAQRGGACWDTIPEQHAPLAAMLEDESGTQSINVIYVDRNGALQRLVWLSDKQSAAGPYDQGTPAPTIRAVGKPSVVYTRNGGGEYVFVKGSDGGIWMRHADNWTPLGGQFYGDPTAVAYTWNNTVWIDVVALGQDDTLYINGILDGAPYGWNQVPARGTLFVGSPAVVSRAADTLDVFSTAEDGNLRWIEYTPAGAWVTPATIPSPKSAPYNATPVARVQNAGELELFGISTTGRLLQSIWSASGWSSISAAQFAIASADYDFGVEGSPAVTSWGPGRMDAFAITRNNKLYWWYTDNPALPDAWQCPQGSCSDPPLLATDATGDPVAISPAENQLELFYRKTDGSLGHLTYGGTWRWTSESLLEPDSIQ